MNPTNISKKINPALSAILFCAVLLAPLSGFAQTASSSPSLQTQSKQIMVGRTRNITIKGVVVEIREDSSLSVEILPSRPNRPVIQAVDISNAQISKGGKKNLTPNAITAGETVEIASQIMPDNTYIAKRVLIETPSVRKSSAQQKRKNSKPRPKAPQKIMAKPAKKK